LGTRRKSREIALQILYLLDVNQGNLEETIENFWRDFRPSEKLKDFTVRIVEGVYSHKKEIDNIIQYYSNNWSINRMTTVDRNILRLAIFEILFCPDIPVKVSLNEAIELGKKFGAEKSAGFINGILDRVSHELCPQKFSLQNS